MSNGPATKARRPNGSPVPVAIPGQPDTEGAGGGGRSGDHGLAKRVRTSVVICTLLLVLWLVIVIVLFAYGVPDSRRARFEVAATAAGLFGAATAIGAALGFAFGLPRSRSMEGALMDQGKPMTPSVRSHYLANSNLIKVSDWLTTILIGLGLVQLGRIAPAVGALAGMLKGPLGGTDSAGVFGVSVCIASTIVAALLCYLWTTVRVREMFEEAEAVADGSGSQ